jgi:hypothetical protein
VTSARANWSALPPPTMLVTQDPAELVTAPVKAGICEQAALPERPEKDGCAKLPAPLADSAVMN